MRSTRGSTSKQVRGPSSRSKLACEQCRKSHVKCDQARPCAFCKRRGIECSLCQEVVFTALEFKAPAAGRLGDFVSGTIEVPATFVDETQEVSNLYQVVRATEEAASVSSYQHPSPWPTLSGQGSPITDSTDAFFLSRYVDFIGPRFDMFDGVQRYFSTVVPQLALSDKLVLLSCVAVAARQYTLVNGHQQHNDEQALTYYSVAIHRLSERLQNSRPDPAVFASCLLIAHCEMVESKATDWDLHLKGTGDLLKLHGWHGMSGGLAQASFWIYCRMIILACLCAGKPTALEPKEWIPGGVFPDPATWTLESWQKKVVFLLGVVQNFWSRTRDADYDEHAVQLDTARWKQLEADLMRHQSRAPTVASPLSILPPSGEDNPFQGVRYLNGTVSAAWQMLHTAFLILTICKPCSRASRLSLLSSPDVTQRAQTYARQIVGNTLTNQCSIAWANAVQLLTIAGQCLVVEPERNACIRALQEIQERTGWDTRASVNRLNAAWENSWRHESASMHSAVTHVDAGKLLYHVWLGDERSLN